MFGVIFYVYKKEVQKMNDLIELKLITRKDAECLYKVRQFKEEDAGEVRNLIVRNFLEVNSKDYGISAMEKLAKVYDVERLNLVALLLFVQAVYVGIRVYAKGCKRARGYY